jgi:hypothetical protein
MGDRDRLGVAGGDDPVEVGGVGEADGRVLLCAAVRGWSGRDCAAVQPTVATTRRLAHASASGLRVPVSRGIRLS